MIDTEGSILAQQIVAENAVPTQDELEHLRPVDHEPHRLSDPNVVEGRLIDTHGERGEFPAVFDRHLISTGLNRGDIVAQKRSDYVDFTADQTVDLTGVVSIVSYYYGVDVGQPWSPIVSFRVKGSAGRA